MIPLSEPTYLILLALTKEPTHGYGIIKTISEVSEGLRKAVPESTNE